jgi:hypothetical protein
MKYRSSLASLGGVLALALALVAGCEDGEHEHGRGRHSAETSIVFGIDQTKGTDGKVTTAVGYEMLDLLGHGSIARGVVTDELSCWAENLDDRLGQPHVEGGVAVFRGGLLPSNGIAVVANRTDDLKLDGAAWANAGDALTFEAKGFAMPDIAPSTMHVPSQDLAISSPADVAAVVPVTAAQELAVSWAPSDAAAAPENVVVSLSAVTAANPNGRGVELRCFFDRSAGTGTIPARMMTRFFLLAGGHEGTSSATDPAIVGTLRMATHRQLTIFADGGWTVYVVATSAQREQPFSLTP